MSTRQPKVIAALYLRGPSLDPALITRLVGREPTQSQRRGDRRITSSLLEVTAKQGLWSLSGESDRVSLDELLTGLLEGLPGDVGLATLPGVEDAHVDLFVGLVTDDEGDATVELSLQAPTLRLLARTGLPWRLTITSSSS